MKKLLLAILFTFGSIGASAQLPHMALKYACEKQGGTWDKVTRTCTISGGTPTEPQKTGTTTEEKDEPKTDGPDGRAAQTPLLKQSIANSTRYSIEIKGKNSPYGYWPVPITEEKCFTIGEVWDDSHGVCWVFTGQ